jgi:hypothetical protein
MTTAPSPCLRLQSRAGNQLIGDRLPVAPVRVVNKLNPTRFAVAILADRRVAPADSVSVASEDLP